MAYQNRNRRPEKLLEDRDGLVPRLNELIRWTRYATYLLAAVAAMISLFFLRDALTVILRLFGV